MTFVWTDRDAQRHELTEPLPILVEREATAREIDRLIGLFDNKDRSIRDLARNQIAPHLASLDRLDADLERWNVHATAVTRDAAEDMIEKIGSLASILARVLLVVELYDEHELLLKDTARLPEERAARLGAPMTELQSRAIAACNVRSPPATTTTRGDATAWLDRQPQFRRQRPSDGGWFAWLDREGHTHRLVDPLSIEMEMAEMKRELAAIRPRLIAEADPAALYETVNKASALWERLKILKQDLERFESAADARDQTECKAYAADWRSKRNG